MRALVYHGVHDVRVDTVDDPAIQDETDVIVRVSSCAICGSDLHLYDGYVPTMKDGDILGHEFMGEVVELGKAVRTLKKGDRVVVPFTISCGQCYFCQHDLWSLCDNSNPNHELAAKAYGFSPAGFYGYSHLFGGYAGGQAELVRVPFADVDVMKVPEGMADEQVLFLGDILPTGYMAAENGNIKGGETVAVWGCGPVGQFTILSAWLLGAGRVIAIDRIPERLTMARAQGKAELINYEETEDDIVDVLKEMTSGRGPDVCIDAVGMEAHGTGLAAVYDKAKQTIRLQSDRPTVLRQAIQACRKGGTVSIPGVYGGFVDKFPIGAAFNKGLHINAGQTHVRRYMQPLLQMIQDDKFDPAFVITHRLRLADGPYAYETFKHKRDNCIKVVLKP